MKEIYNYNDVIEIGKQSVIIIWGAGKLGLDLICDLRLVGYSNYYVSDTNHDVIKYMDKHIFPENILDITRNHTVSIILTVKSNNAVNEIMKKINILLCNTEGSCRVEIYRYILEDLEEMIFRRKEKGFFNGISYKKALNIDDAIDTLKRMIKGDSSFLFSRWGTIEGDIVYRIRAGVQPSLTENFTLQQNAGVFPITESILKLYYQVMEKAAVEIDMLCAFYWQRHLEKWIELYSPNAVIVSSALEYPFFENPWTEALQGMKVLVVHPFAKLIDKQYINRDKLFENDKVLPKFKLITYQAVQSMGGNDNYKDWIEALHIMCNEISKINFDIALIGCGAYGMPLGAFIKSKLHKKAIHMGGSLQILFGIKGKRWEENNYDYQHKLYNEYWVRPTEDLKPQNYKDVEDGCYW